MKIILSNALDADKFTGFQVIETLSGLASYEDQIECLIIHKYADNSENKENKEGVERLAPVLSAIRDRNEGCKFFYICSEPKAAVRMLIGGVDGIVLTDEFYFDSEDELSTLIDSYCGPTQTPAMLPAAIDRIAMVKEFMDGLTKDDERCRLPFYITQVEESLMTIERDYNNLQTLFKEMGNSAVEVLQANHTNMTRMEKMLEGFQGQLSQLKAQAEHDRRMAAQSNNGRRAASSLTIFPPVSYMVPPSKKMVLIKEFSPCRYLTSFVLAYQNYLKVLGNRRVKVIFVIPASSPMLMTKYTEAKFCVITNASKERSDLYEQDLIATNIPQKDIMLRILETGRFDTIIVVDRLFNNTIVQGDGVKELAAFSGLSDVEKYPKVKRGAVISSGAIIPGSLLTIPNIAKYPPPNKVDSRIHTYMQLGTTAIDGKAALFDIMDKFLGITVTR